MDALESEFLFEIRITTAPPLMAGPTPAGQRMIVSILGGTFEGPRLRGTVHATGNDAIFIQPGGRFLLDVRTALQTDDGALIYVQYRGIRNGPTDVLKRLGRGPGGRPGDLLLPHCHPVRDRGPALRLAE